jgi:hypothetical protein
MRNHFKSLAALAIGVAACFAGTATPALAQAAPVVIDGSRYLLPQGAAKNLDAVRALIAASDALGMTRAIVRTLGGSTQSLQYKATGTMGGQPVSAVVAAFDYRLPSIRLDVTRPDKSREITVANGDVSWDESKPGIFLQPGKTAAADRLLPLWLLPPAVVHAGVAAAETMTLAQKGAGVRELTIPVPRFRTDLRATLNAKGEVTHTEMSVGGKLYSGDFANYQNDRLDYHLYFPHRIVLKVDGTTVADLTLSEHISGPYAVWPVPAEMKPTAAR